MGIKCCWNCTDRVVGCHTTCKKYKEEKADYDKKQKEIREKHKCVTDIIDIHNRRFTKR